MLKFLLRTLAVTALAVLAADVCLGATAGSRVSSKEQAAAIQHPHSQAPRGGRLNSASGNKAGPPATAVGAQKGGAAGAGVAPTHGGQGDAAGSSQISKKQAAPIRQANPQAATGDRVNGASGNKAAPSATAADAKKGSATSAGVAPADAGPGVVTGSTLISKKRAAAIWLAHPGAPGKARLNSAPRKNNAAGAATAADAQKGGAAAAGVPMRNASIVNVTAAAPPAARIPTGVLRGPAIHITPPPQPAAVRDGVISGTSMKHSPSMLASVGGAATGNKGTAVINGTSMRQKPH